MTSYGKCGMGLITSKVHGEKLCRVSPNVTSNFFEAISQTTSHIQLVASCVIGFTYIPIKIESNKHSYNIQV